MSTLELEHIKHTSSSSNNLSVHSDGSLTLQALNGNLTLNGNLGVGTTTGSESLNTTGNLRFQTNNKTRIEYLNSTGAYALGTTGGAAIGFEYISGGADHEIFFETHNGGISHTERMRINKDGYVLKPQTPACFVYKAGSGNATGDSGAGALDTAGLNNGNHFNGSTGRFTCPVAGMYMVCWTMMNSQSNTGTAVCTLRVNGVGYKYFHVESSHPQGQSDQLIYNANANDYFDMSLTHYHWNGGSSFKYPSMSVFLIG